MAVRPPFPRWLLVRGAWWLGSLCLWLPAGGVGVAIHTGVALAVALIGSSALAVGWTVALGYGLGVRREWRWLPLVALVGTGVLMVSYAIGMIAFNPNDPNSDIEAGAGLGILVVPTGAVVTLLLALGAAIGRLRDPLRAGRPS